MRVKTRLGGYFDHIQESDPAGALGWADVAKAICRANHDEECHQSRAGQPGAPISLAGIRHEPPSEDQSQAYQAEPGDEGVVHQDIACLSRYEQQAQGG